jgi:hypothetical protein
MDAETPTPRNRKSKGGEESIVPPGFTLESSVGAHGQPHALERSQRNQQEVA